jgi:glycosyltransferase involved in cell wall biosynthesis
MPVLNAVPFLNEAVDSVLAQSFGDFEFIVVDDGSSDGSLEVLHEYARRDARVRVLQNSANIGVAQTLNRGLAECRGEYVARMDADDVALPERFARQVEFMDSRPDVGVCGTWFTAFGELDGTYRHPEDGEDIKIAHLLRDSAICHPTAFMRRALLQRTGIRYPEGNFPAQDLWLWVRLGFVSKLANIPEALLRYRIHPRQVSGVKRSAQSRKAAEAQLFFASSIFGRALTDAEIAAHAVLARRAVIDDRAELELVAAYGASLLDANAASGAIDRDRLATAIAERLETVPREYAEHSYKYSQSYDLPLLVNFVRDPLRPVYNLDGGDVVRFAFKCLVGHVPRP